MIDMDIIIRPSKLSGMVAAPPSKSEAHRLLIAAFLANGESVIKNLALSADMRATLGALEAMGADISLDGDTARITGGKFLKKASVDSFESGSTLRFLMPVSAALNIETEFKGRGRLPQRTYSELCRELSRHGASFSAEEGLPCTVNGQINAGIYEVCGNISSQFVSGLLFALPLLEGDSEIVIVGRLESEAYVSLTLSTLSKFGIKIERTEKGFKIRGEQRYQPQNVCVEGDWSNSAFWLAADALGADIGIFGLDINSAQGDKAMASALQSAKSEVECGSIFRAGRAKRAFDADVSAIPDLAPILAVTAAGLRGKSTLYNAARLRLKESDRLATTAAMLAAFGVKCKEFADKLEIYGEGGFCGGRIDGANDHRIVMSAAIAAAFATGESVITQAEAVEKSYPDFFEKYVSLGGIVK